MIHQLDRRLALPRTTCLLCLFLDLENQPKNPHDRFPLTMLTNNSSDFDLTIRQQPDRARVAGGKEKERKPIDPPPIVQLRVREEGSYLAQ